MFAKRHPPPGSRPGTLVATAEAVPTRIRVMHYTPEEVREAEIDSPEQIEPFLQADGVTWVDVQGLADHGELQRIAALFTIHPLALEDVVNAPQRPKAEAYEQHLFYISRMVRMDEGSLVIEQVSLFFNRRFVLTFQERHGDVLDPVRERMRQGKGPMRRSGGDYLAYAIIDAIIDYYYPVIEQMSDELERLEQRVLRQPDATTLSIINQLKRNLLELRRAVWPQRDAINALLRGDSPFVTDTVQVYLRDCYDHCVQIVDIIETYRELAGGLFSTYLSAVGNRTNDVMKVLTIMASIFIPLTFMAGIYGMNFETMPELHVRWAYPALLVAMLATAVGMLWFFRRRGWIGSSDGEPEE